MPVHRVQGQQSDRQIADRRLLGQHRRQKQSSRARQPDAAGRPACRQHRQQSQQHEQSGQKLGPPDHVGHRLAMDGMHGEQQRRRAGDVEIGEQPPGQPPDQPAAGGVHQDVDAVEPGRPQPVRGVVQREAEDRQRAIETVAHRVGGLLARGRVPPVAQPDLARGGERADARVVADDGVIVVGEIAADRVQKAQPPEQGRRPARGRRSAAAGRLSAVRCGHR